MSYTVFLSHSSRNRNLVINVRDELKKAGIGVYLAEEHPQPGKNLPQKILNNIKSANCMVVLLTDTGLRSQFVNQEIGAAKALNKPIIPMVEKKVMRKVGGLLAGLELIVFDKAKPEQAISEVSLYVSRLRLSLRAQLEKVEREEILKMVAVIAFLVFAVILLYFAFRKK
jgi:hypothetical protein